MRSRLISGLKRLEAHFKQGGRLDDYLATRRFRVVFEEQPNLTSDDVAETPAELKSAQEKFLAALAGPQRNRDIERAKLAKSYRAYLEKLKVKRTRQDQIEGALAVKAEIDRVTALVDLSILDELNRPAVATPSSGRPVAGDLVAYGNFSDGSPVTLPRKTEGVYRRRRGRGPLGGLESRRQGRGFVGTSSI